MIIPSFLFSLKVIKYNVEWILLAVLYLTMPTFIPISIQSLKVQKGTSLKSILNWITVLGFQCKPDNFTHLPKPKLRFYFIPSRKILLFKNIYFSGCSHSSQMRFTIPGKGHFAAHSPLLEWMQNLFSIWSSRM